MFFPVLLLTGGPSRGNSLFIPLAITRGCWRCWRPTCCRSPSFRRWRAICSGTTTTTRRRASAGGLSAAFDRGFRAGEERATATCLRRSCSGAPSCFGCFGLVIVATGMLAPVVGTDFFPTSDVGILKMHVRAATRHAARGNREDRGAG